ncbi:MAG: hypothetical protein KY446_00230 [Proteobacteria bacterium]|nr:hypothetical protein [Pseudomonadota bacterium]MBW3616165.1 hypothetical protein [Pseudomonadota bacterium]
MAEDILVPLFVFGSIAAMVIAPFYFRSRDRAKLLDTVRTAYDRGQPVPPELINALQARQASLRPSPERDLRSGIIWLAVGVGLAIFAVLMSFEEDDAIFPLLGIASIPGTVGLTLIALSFIGRDRRP